MSESQSIQNLFRAGMTREQFIDKYAELKETQDAETSSIFSQDMSTAAIGALFDFLNRGENDTLDEDEIQTLTNFVTTDGENALTNADIDVLYEKTIKNILDKYGTDNPQEMYDKAVNGGEYSSFEYTQAISSQIEIIEELIEARNLESVRKMNGFQSQIDDLILRSSQISTETKTRYDSISSSIRRLQKAADENKRLIAQKHDEMLNAQASAKYASEKATDENPNEEEIQRYQAQYASLSAEYAELTSKQSKYTSDIASLTKSLQALQQKAMSEDSSIKAKVSNLNERVDAERESAKRDISGYENQASQLSAAQDYAVSHSEVVTGEYSDSDTTEFSYDAAELKRKWAVKGEPQFSDGFYNKVCEISKRLGCDPNALMAVMKSESGLKTTAQNPHGGATGLIQFMPSTARALGTSTEALRKMSPEQQLVYVEKFLTQTKRTAGFKSDDKLDAGTLYTLVFLPGYAKRDVLCTKGTKYYRYNAGLDLDHDGSITKKDMNNRVHKFMKA